MGNDLDELAAVVTAEVKKEFELLKRRCLIATRRKCEKAIKNEIEEFTKQVKTGVVATEADAAMKIDLLQQILVEILEPVDYPEKDSFVSLQCAEMANLAQRQMLQTLKLKQVTD